MKTIKAIVAAAIGVGVGSACLAWFRYPGSLAWPGLVLARFGLPHCWVVAVGCVLGLLVWFAIRSRGRVWGQVIGVSLLVSAAYCAIAFFFGSHSPVPLPRTTPYDDLSAQKTAYLRSYEVGYREGMVGEMRTYCFYPETETRGFEEGSRDGSVIWDRFLGRQIPGRGGIDY